MTELERHLAQALTALSEQHKREQKQLCGQVEDLRKQLRRFEEQVRYLAQDYKQLAADYGSLVESLRRR